MNKFIAALCAIFALLLSSHALAQQTDSGLSQEVTALQKRLSDLQSQDKVAAEDIKLLADSMVATADEHSSLMGRDAGYDPEHGFFIGSGDLILHPGILFQFRNATNYSPHGKASGEKSTQNGFEIPVLKIMLDGRAYEKIGFTFVWSNATWQTDMNPGGLFLEDAYITYDLSRKITLKAGQFKDHVYHEAYVGDARQLAASRSLVNELISGGITDRVQGASLMYGDNFSDMHIELAFHDGISSLNSSFQNPVVPPSFGDQTHFGVSGRVEWKATQAGQWKDYVDLTARGTTDDLLVLGVGADWTEGIFFDQETFFVQPFVGGDRVLAAVDAQWELAKPRVAIFGALLADWTHYRHSMGRKSRLNWGGIIQAGWMLNNRIELFGRYDFTHMSSAFVLGNEDNFHEFTIGANYYLGADGSLGHHAKITVDAGYLPHGSPTLAPNVGTGSIIGGNESKQVYLRGQLQIAI